MKKISPSVSLFSFSLTPLIVLTSQKLNDDSLSLKESLLSQTSSNKTKGILNINVNIQRAEKEAQENSSTTPKRRRKRDLKAQIDLNHEEDLLNNKEMDNKLKNQGFEKIKITIKGLS